MANANVVLCALLGVCFMAVAVHGQGDCYVPTSDVGLQAQLASDVCQINEALDMDPPDYAAAMEAYETGTNNPDTPLKTIATAEYNTPMYQQYATFFGDAVWMDTLITQALNGEEPFDTDVKRVQMVKKLLQSSVLVQQVFYHMDKAVASAEDGDAAAALVSWDMAMAAYYGDNVNCAPFGNGQSRGVEFDTISDGVSNTNRAAHQEFSAGAAALQDTIDLDALQDARQEIIRQITIIYIQSIFKYATLMDEGIENGDDVAKDQAEGFAYYHAIYPIVADVDADLAQAIFDAFDVSQEPDEEKAEQVKPGVRENFEGLNVTDEEVNDFDDSRSFAEPEEPACELNNPFDVITTGESDFDR